jgi:hypothetical protein
MNQNRTANDDFSANRPPASGDELLPPVEPPSAGFIIQLFVVPAFIVLVIVGVWLLFNSLVRRTSPEKIVEGLESGPMIARWQRANELAQLLSDERYADFKRNPESATNVAHILDREITAAGESGGMRDEDVMFRFFLAQALGKFEVAEGMDVLIKAAETRRNENELRVQRGALEAIAERIYVLKNLDPPIELADEGVESALLKASEDEEPKMREAASFGLGHLGTPAAFERLEVLVDDPAPEVRYNAAVAIARRGNVKSQETLAEMLDPEETAGMKNEPEGRARQLKRELIVASALKAAEELRKQNPDAELPIVVEALESLAGADDETLEKAQLPERYRAEAQRVLDQLNRQPSAAAQPKS